MTDRSNTMDFGGLTLVCKDIQTGANAPQQSGTALSDTVDADTIKSGTLTIVGPTGAAVAAGTGSGSAGNTGGAVATKVLQVDVNGTTYYIPLCSTNA